VLLGMQLIAAVDWVLPLLGLLIIYLAVKLAIEQKPEVHPEKNLLVRVARRLVRVSSHDHGARFFVRDGRQWEVTPLFLVLLVVESVDIVFAIDSVPAIFGVTRDPFLVFTSNVLAILGLRALYFLMVPIMDRFRFISFGISAVLAFIGVKMVGDYAVKRLGWLGEGEELVPYWASLGVVVLLLGISIAASLIWPTRTDPFTPPSEQPAR
jgi:TerC family integral membrane protein